MSNHDFAPPSDHRCPSCGEEVEMCIEDWETYYDEASQKYLITHECGTPLVLDGEGGYGDDGTQWGWWIEGVRP